VTVCTGDVLLGLLQSFLDVVGPLQENLGLLLGLLLLSGRGFVLLVLLTIVLLFLVAVVVIIKALLIVLFAGGLVLGLLLAREGLLGLVLGQQLFGGLGLGIERVDLGYRSDSPHTTRHAAVNASVSQPGSTMWKEALGRAWIMGHQPADLGGPSRPAASGQGRS
jgi:hypothetical protein